jgi:type I restriction enzyme R subunit
VAEGDLPVAPKEEQAAELRKLLDELTGYVTGFAVDLRAGLGTGGFDWVAWLGDATEKLLVDDDTRRGYLRRADAAAKQWKAVKPHPAAADAQPEMTVIVRLAQRIRAVVGQPDISGVLGAVEQLLEESVAAEPFIIDSGQVKRIDLTQIDFDSLAGLFGSGKKNTAAQQLRASLERKIDRLTRLNPTRVDYAAKLQEVIDRYNSGSANIDALFEELKDLARSLDDEQDRHVREELTEEELAIFDLLTRPEPALTAAEEAQVKKVVRSLLERLKWSLLVLDWKKRQRTRAAVQVAITGELDAGLPDVYDRRIYQEKCSRVFQHIYESYQGAGRSIYEEAA